MKDPFSPDLKQVLVLHWVLSIRHEMVPKLVTQSEKVPFLRKSGQMASTKVQFGKLQSNHTLIHEK